MNIVEAVETVLAAVPGALCVSSLGTATSALRAASRDGPHLYLGGSMGAALSVALGVAEQLPGREVRRARRRRRAADGRELALVARRASRPANLLVVVLADGPYSITGGQPLVVETRFAEVAASLPGLASATASTREDLAARRGGDAPPGARLRPARARARGRARARSSSRPSSARGSPSRSATPGPRWGRESDDRSRSAHRGGQRRRPGKSPGKPGSQCPDGPCPASSRRKIREKDPRNRPRSLLGSPRSHILGRTRPRWVCCRFVSRGGGARVSVMAASSGEWERRSYGPGMRWRPSHRGSPSSLEEVYAPCTDSRRTRIPVALAPAAQRPVAA